jgi:hypothetical protein
MVQRAARIAQFVSDRDPKADVMVQVLCQDHVGTYTLPFLCTKTGSYCITTATSEVLDVEVLGWRHPPKGATAERPFWATPNPKGYRGSP